MEREVTWERGERYINEHVWSQGRGRIEGGRWSWVGQGKVIVGKWRQLYSNINKKEENKKKTDKRE